jgi:hypothetical protein
MDQSKILNILLQNTLSLNLNYLLIASDKKKKLNNIADSIIK